MASREITKEKEKEVYVAKAIEVLRRLCKKGVSDMIYGLTMDAFSKEDKLRSLEVNVGFYIGMKNN